MLHGGLSIASNPFIPFALSLLFTCIVVAVVIAMIVVLVVVVPPYFVPSFLLLPIHDAEDLRFSASAPKPVTLPHTLSMPPPRRR